MASSDLIRDLAEHGQKPRVVRMAPTEGGPRRTGRALVSSSLMMVSDVAAVLLALVVSLYLGSHAQPASLGLRHLIAGVGISTSESLAYLAWFIVTLLVVSWHYGL